ncbi:hypothetical protein [Curtobacterium sp. MCBD17_003]|uniref:hypothetical protein n=1 Tax=Curtobacterium sp. MCBD17_003 TaxID=2175667 RepID=UPI000DA73BB3|nr:hypothetical protein [Curtobacterium sp. MCBD17_003]WIE55623.1 hypothetical protein DEI88_005335 [Curtobacterium sp. MCBD17_003]
MLNPKALVPLTLVAALAGGVLVAQPAAAAPDVSSAIALIANTDTPDNYGLTDAQRHEDGTITVLSATLQDIDVVLPSNPTTTLAGQTGQAEVHITAPWGQNLHVGRYSGIDFEGDPTAAKVHVSYGSSEKEYVGDFDVLDLAADSTGRVTRFDIVFRNSDITPLEAYFGEIRMGEPEVPVRFAGQHLEWPEMPVNGTRVWAEESIRNASAASVRLGRAAVSGADASDFALASDACSGRALAPDATCVVRVGFSPKAGGPRVATLSIAAGSATATASLAGSANLGTTKISTTSASYIDQHRGDTTQVRTNTDTEGPTVIYESPRSTPGYWMFGTGHTYDFWTGGHILDVTSKSGTLTAGRHAEQWFGNYGLDFSNGASGCGGSSGTETITSVGFLPDHLIDHLHATFTATCPSDPTHPITGLIQWQDRSDVTAPAAPKGLTLIGSGTRKVTWTRSASADAATTIVRLVSGTGVDATPTSGYAVGASASGTATLTLPKGRRYELMAWAVDETGNVGSPRTIPFIS